MSNDIPLRSIHIDPPGSSGSARQTTPADSFGEQETTGQDDGAPLTASRVWSIVRKNDKSKLRDLVNKYGPKEVILPATKGPSPNTTTFHVAAQSNAVNCLDFLSTNPPTRQYLEYPDRDGATALLVAVVNAKRETVKKLLDHGANINARNDNYYGALHLLVMEMSKQVKQKQLLDVAKLLLSHPYVDRLDLEPHDKQKQETPLGMAKKMETSVPNIKELIELLETAARNKQSGHSRPMAAHVVDEVSMGRIDNLKKILAEKSEEECKKAVNSNLGSHSLLFHAVETSNITLVEILMEYGAKYLDENMNHEYSLYHAAVKGNEEVFTTMIEMIMEEEDGKEVLRQHFLYIVEEIIKSDRKMAVEPVELAACLRFLVQNAKKIELQITFSSYTAQRIATLLDKDTNDDIVSILLELFQTLLEDDNITISTYFSPEVLHKAMNRYITISNDELHNSIMKLDYSFFIPPPLPDPVNEMEVLKEVCSSKEHRDLITHPLVQTLLFTKWKKARIFCIANMLIYLVFVVVLTVFVYFQKDLRLMEERLSQLNDTSDVDLKTDVNNQQSIVNWLLVPLLLLCLYMFVREGFQIFISGWRSYRNGPENWLEWLLLVAVVSLCFPLGVDSTRHLAAWAMIVAWFNFLLLGSHIFPKLAVDIVNLKKVMWKYLEFAIILGVLIIAFTCSINLASPPSGVLPSSRDNQTSDFDTFLTTLPRIIAMSMGEFGYSDFAPAKKFNPALLVFLLFLFSLVLVFMNVMNGEAVVSTQEVLKDVSLYKLKLHLEMGHVVETALMLFNRICSLSPCLRSCLYWTQVLQRQQLHVKVYHKGRYNICSGNNYEYEHPLDDDTTACLRKYWEQHLRESKRNLANRVITPCNS